ncbi:hypothetical protein SeMB42_g05075 [Synchytrium endobioticum]|uniref:VOC domain-containing protein n=1 Tax=Synchytrium endobioticum TaxID=286115 RepID=A0A507CTV6_9FUNG|nr:hypothetical protein SeMB42_g05075 [Synchytrium endobioticum]
MSGIIEKARFRYLRFRCHDLPKTIEFYTLMGMHIEWRSDISSDQILFSMAFPSVNGVDSTSTTANDFSLLFEYNAKAGAPHSEDTRSAGPSQSKESQYNMADSEYLVIYVQMLPRIVKRMQTKGFDCQIPVQDFAELKYCIMVDPAGIEVRLMELTDSQLNDFRGKKLWYGRLAYYTIPTLIHDAIDFYESIFAGGSEQPTNANAGNAASMPDSDARTRNGVVGADSKKPLGKMKTTGFRKVDDEDIVVGLSHMMYAWMGHDPREFGCTLCFTERRESEAYSRLATVGKVKRSTVADSKLLSVGFEVPNLDMALNKLKYDHPVQLEWVDGRQTIPSLGTLSRFVDPMNDLRVDLYANIPILLDPILDEPSSASDDDLASESVQDVTSRQTPDDLEGLGASTNTTPLLPKIPTGSRPRQFNIQSASLDTLRSEAASGTKRPSIPDLSNRSKARPEQTGLLHSQKKSRSVSGLLR